MKTALNAWTVSKETGFEAMFRQLKEAGFDAVELNVDPEGAGAHSLTLATTQPELAGIRNLSETYGLPVVSISTSLWGGKMGADPAFSRTLLEKQLEYAAALGADGILTVPGGQYPDIPLQEDRSACIRFLQSMRPVIAGYGLKVGVENVWNGFFTSPLDMAGFLDEVDNPLVGAYFDVGNVTAFSWPERWIEVLGGRIQHVHVKDFLRGGNGINTGGRWVDIPRGSTAWEKVVPALKQAGYDGCLTGEVFKEDPALPYETYYRDTAGSIRRLLTLS